MTIFYKKINLLLSKKIKKKKINFLITGGETAKGLYKYWQKNNDFLKNKNINFFLSDERLVPTNKKSSNYNLIKKNLFFDKISINYNFLSFFNDIKKYKAQIKKYKNSLPKYFDIGILSSGSDGHIASIFSNNRESIKSNKKIIFSSSSNKPRKRISLSLKYIKKTKFLIIMFEGTKKGRLAAESIINQSKKEMIISYFSKNFWIFDKKAYIAYKKKLTN